MPATIWHCAVCLGHKDSYQRKVASAHGIIYFVYGMGPNVCPALTISYILKIMVVFYTQYGVGPHVYPEHAISYMLQIMVVDYTLLLCWGDMVANVSKPVAMGRHLVRPVGAMSANRVSFTHGAILYSLS